MRKLMTVVCVLVLSISAYAEQTIWLNDINLDKVQQGWGRARKNKSVDGNSMSIAGTKFEKGIGSHSIGNWYLDLKGKGLNFSAMVGIDDEAGAGRGSVVFEVHGDGKVLWKSPVMKQGMKPEKVDVPLKGVKLLRLHISDQGDFGHDHADWVEPVIVMSEGRPQPCTPPREILPEDYGFALLTEMLEQRSTNKWNRGSLKRGYNEVLSQAVNKESMVLAGDVTPADIAYRRTWALLADIKAMKGAPDLDAEQDRLESLRAEVTDLKEKITSAGGGKAVIAENKDAILPMLKKIAEVRRRIAFSNPLLDGLDKILFVKRDPMPDSEGQGGHMCDQFFGHNSTHGGNTKDRYGLFVLEEPFSDSPKVRNLLEKSVVENGRLKGQSLVGKGGFLSPDLSYDARQILFAYSEGSESKWTTNSSFHVFRVNVDGTDLVQLTDGTVNDFDPCFLPNGRIVFISERRGGYGRCHGRPVPSYTLHSMLDDGSDIVTLSPHETNEWQPSVMRDGMILYTRWDYVDRGFNQAHHPWITYPDGRDPRAVSGNTRESHSAAPFLTAHLRSIPGSHKILSTAAAHHGEQRGTIIMIDPKVEDNNKMAQVKRVTSCWGMPETETGYHKRGAFSTAWPLSENYYLCVADLQPGWLQSRGQMRPEQTNYGIYLLDCFGNMELLYKDVDVSCLDPIPLRPRERPPELPHQTLVGKPRPMKDRKDTVDKTKLPKTGRIGLVNVYDSRHPLPEGVEITHLRIFQILPKTTPGADNPNLGHGGNKGAKWILGTVPVEKDGSAYFEAPVNKPILMHAVDKTGTAVQGMRSATYVKPGEFLTCNGCHEKRGSTPKIATGTPLAFKRAPSKIRPEPYEGTRPFSYPRLVQPVLDAKCVDCHEKNKGKPKVMDLARGDFTKDRSKWYTSYKNLQKYVHIYGNAVFTTASTVPGEFGAKKSPLYHLLLKGHHKVKLTNDEMMRLTLWMDNNGMFFGHEDGIEAQANGELVWASLE
ncbi:MAG: NPCBM/NEW2 domain-containing protein [Kiritimatiellia bacterium]|jgi:hypothetical protein|nr:NPCBM/NEW2 domain-containing protein [Kiritimatiellia bacterium]MDP6847818.1 NPCBM/NEW2 domain-containing protein [Kiritimatiellia bacterium]